MRISTVNASFRQGVKMINSITGSQKCVPKDKIGVGADYYIITISLFVL